MIRVDNGFKDLLPSVSAAEYEQLKENILRDGCLEPLTVWGDILIDGHNRLKICTENNIPYEVRQVEFKSRDEAEAWIISTQLGRRNLTDFQRNEIALKYEAVIAEKMKERQLEGNRRGAEVKNSGLSSNDDKPKERTNKDTELGKIAGTSESSITRTRTILNHGTPEDIQEVRDGKATISGKAKEIKDRKKAEKKTPPQDQEPPEDPPEEPEDEQDDRMRVYRNLLTGNLYMAWKTLFYTHRDMGNDFPAEFARDKKDEPELKDIVDRIWAFIERKGGPEVVRKKGGKDYK